MKKALLALFAVAFVASMCFAEEESVPSQTSSNAAAPAQVPGATAAPAQPPASTTSLAPTFIGTVDSVASRNGTSGTNPQITVKDSDRHETTFFVASDATIIDKDGNPTTLDWIGSDDKVSIKYITNPDTTKTAKSIKVLGD